ncbi:MAG: RlmE family RNA methyltransferase [Nitrosarchaeum sp.]|nr:RlmE family RNA methyltransferase [Nitrosarchaeum sp.]
MKDAHTVRAKREGLRARSAYKLEELERKYGFLKGASRVLDLGAWPGGWSIVASRFAEVVALDLEPIDPIPGVRCLVGDMRDEVLAESLPAVDVVLCDAAPKTTGNIEKDQYDSVVLAQQALSIARRKLLLGGSFVCKVFQGEEFEDFLAEVRSCFGFVKATKPPTSRKESKEMYVVAMRFAPQRS